MNKLFLLLLTAFAIASAQMDNAHTETDWRLEAAHMEKAATDLRAQIKLVETANPNYDLDARSLEYKDADDAAAVTERQLAEARTLWNELLGKGRFEDAGAQSLAVYRLEAALAVQNQVLRTARINRAKALKVPEALHQHFRRRIAELRRRRSPTSPRRNCIVRWRGSRRS